MPSLCSDFIMWLTTSNFLVPLVKPYLLLATTTAVYRFLGHYPHGKCISFMKFIFFNRGADMNNHSYHNAYLFIQIQIINRLFLIHVLKQIPYFYPFPLSHHDLHIRYHHMACFISHMTVTANSSNCFKMTIQTNQRRPYVRQVLL